MEAIGIDAESGLVFSQMRAPAGASVISPLTSVIDAVGNEATVRSALGLDSGTNALQASTKIIAFNPALSLASSDPSTAEDAARLTAVNLQLLAMAAILKDTNGDPVDYAVSLDPSSRYISEIIGSTSQLDLTNPATVRALLVKSRYQFGTTSGQLDAMASLIARYNGSLPKSFASSDAVRGWAWAFRFFVMPEFKILASQWPNPASSRIAAITATDIASAAQEFAAFPGLIAGAYMTTPNYTELVSPSFSTSRVGCGSPIALPSCDDRNPFTIDFGDMRLSNVSSVQPGLLSASFSGDTLQLVRMGTFEGLTRVTYSSASGTGASANGILFVRVRLPD